jgi:hypothetical protein
VHLNRIFSLKRVLPMNLDVAQAVELHENKVMIEVVDIVEAMTVLSVKCMQ